MFFRQAKDTMKPGPNIRRPRSRGNGKRFISKNQSFESSGPDVKVRGTVQQVLEKYLTLARDASSVGDRVAAEGYLQYAEHYYRLLNNDAQNANGQMRTNGRDGHPRMNTPAQDMSGDGNEDDLDDESQPDPNNQNQGSTTPA